MYCGKRYLFCGVGGSGMSSLAKIMLSKGAYICGSDRNYDHGRFPELYMSLESKGVVMVDQDGTGVTSDLDAVIVSSAIEPSIPDVKAAMDLGIPIIKRAQLLSEICNDSQSICVGGTNGKSTVTGMIGWMMAQLQCDPTIINGGGMLNFGRDNAVVGQGNYTVVETDESDGTITNFHAHIAVLTNISEDHKDMSELMDIFRQFLDQSQHQILNIDCPNVRALSVDYPNALTYSVDDEVGNINLMVPGAHNQSNACAAIKVADALNLNHGKSIKALEDFRGITSRLEVVGQKNGITIIDDFGHNPDKIEAGLKTLKESNSRLIFMYQPHGFKPTRDHKDALIEIFAKYLTVDDVFYMPDILYFGGTVDKNISSADIIDPLIEKGLNAHYIADKLAIEKAILNTVKSGDTVCIMGARDDSLRAMAKSLFVSIL